MKHLILLLLMISLSKLWSQADAPTTKDITYRPPTVAGSFYPDNADTLKKWINDYLKQGKNADANTEIFGLVVPHAGYVYSGWVAGLAYKQVEGKHYDDIIILAPSHTKAFKGASVFDGDAYVTPLGNVMVDKTLSSEIAHNNDLVKFSRNGHQWGTDRNEHSIEVQLPFLQIVQPGVPIVPIVIGSQNNETSDALLKAIVSSVRKLKRKVLIVASSDLSHYHDDYTAKRMDQPILRAFYRYDYFKLALNLFSRQWEACGGGPIVVAMMAAEQLGANKASPIIYSNSAKSPYVKGDRQKVVGYFSGIIYNDGENTGIFPNLTEDSKKELVKIARETIKSVANKSEQPYEINVVPKDLSEEYAVFVTLHENGKLRGCMGHTIAENTLMMAVKESAKLAGSQDPRFPPVKNGEIDNIELEITILSRMKRVLDFKDIQPGVDGILLRLGYNSGLFLPQVATEQGWSRKELLENIGRKAGLSTDAYKNPKAELYIFRGLVIH